MSYRRNLLFFILVLIIYFAGSILASFFNSGFGDLQLDNVVISGQENISGFSYRLKDISQSDSIPAVVLTHGVSGSKQMMSALALELARNGFAALTVDLVGHGGSEGVFGSFRFERPDSTLGIKDAVQYLKQQPFVDSSRIGLVGHSLGAGAIRAAALECSDIQASVFIGGGLGGSVIGSEFGVLNSSFPKNLLVIVGEHDVLFDLEVTEQLLVPVFGYPLEILPNMVYGDFSNGTARSLIVPKTTHLFEPVDPITAIETVDWIKKSLDNQISCTGSELIYQNREIAIAVSLTAFSVLILPLSSIIIDKYPNLIHKNKKVIATLKDWKILAILGILGLFLFLPMFLAGSFIPFPPFVFGNSFAWWLFATGIAGLIIVQYILPKYTLIRVNLKSTFKRSFSFKSILVAVAIFSLMYFIVYFSESLFLNELRIVVIPLFKIFPTIKRALGFFTFIPFYLIYFFMEGLYLHQLRSSKENSQTKDLIKTIIIRTLPYLALISVNYLPMFLLNVRVFPSFAGFIMEFILGMFPVFVIPTIFSWWFYKKTTNLGIGAMLNALLFAWLSAALFPIII